MAVEQSTYPDPNEAMDIGDPPNSKPGTKRRVSRAGTRSVASLTPEQLSRKRANDREAQRSIRQRTKTHIEELEQRIRELSQDHDARNFEQIRRRNSELEEELRHLTELLGRSGVSVASSPNSIPPSYEARYNMDILEEAHMLPYSPSCNAQNIGGPSSPFPGFLTSSAGDLLSTFAPDYSGLPSPFSYPERARSDSFNDTKMGFEDLPSSPTVAAPRGNPNNSRPDFGRSRSYPCGGFGMPANDPPLRMIVNTNGMGPSPLPGQPISPVDRSLMNINGMRQPLPPPPPPPPPPTSHPLMLHQNQSQPQFDAKDIPQQNGTPAWELGLRFLPPTGPYDSILLGLLQRQRSLATENTPGSLLIGPHHPDLRALVNPEMSHNVHPVASIICNLFQRLNYIGLAEKVAGLFLVYRFVQWQILPTIETYQNLPDWFRPQPSQLVTAHPFWTSLVTWEPLRDLLVRDQQRYATQEFMDMYQSCITVNWPFRDEDILVFVGEEVRITETFIRHIETQANWSLSEAFQQRYPELRDICRFSDLSARQMNSNLH